MYIKIFRYPSSNHMLYKQIWSRLQHAYAYIYAVYMYITKIHLRIQPNMQNNQWQVEQPAKSTHYFYPEQSLNIRLTCPSEYQPIIIGYFHST